MLVLVPLSVGASVAYSAHATRSAAHDQGRQYATEVAGRLAAQVENDMAAPLHSAHDLAAALDTAAGNVRVHCRTLASLCLVTLPAGGHRAIGLTPAGQLAADCLLTNP
mgnify:CR=1 FL=1